MELGEKVEAAPALVVIDRKDPPVPVDAVFGVLGIDSKMLTSLPLQTFKGQRLLLLAESEAPESFTVGVGQEMDVEHIHVHLKQFAEEDTGEIKTAARIVLISPTGKMVCTYSPFVAHAVARLFGVFTPPPWNPPLRFRLAQYDAGNNKRKFGLELLTTEWEPAKPQKKGK